MQKTSCAALGLGSAMLLMMRYKAVRMSAGYLGDILHVDAGGQPQRLHHNDCAALLPAATVEKFLLMHPFEESLGSVADELLRLKAAIEQRAIAFCPEQQQRLIEAEYRRIALEVCRKAAMILPLEVRQIVKAELFPERVPEAGA